MAEKGYYYLKLKENFFDSDEMKILESMENGYLYSNILLKLYLKALKNNGKLTFNEYIPYDIKMLATIVGHNVDVVKSAIKLFQGMHLIEILDNGTIYMLDMQKMIGSISSEGVRKAEYRERILLEKKGTSVGQCPDIISISSSSSQSQSISSSKLDGGVGEEEPTQSNSKAPKHKYGEYSHILLTDDELSKLNNDYGEEKTQKAITYLDEYIEMKGTKYKSHYLALKKWVFEAVDEKESKAKSSAQKPEKGMSMWDKLDKVFEDERTNQDN